MKESTPDQPTPPSAEPGVTPPVRFSCFKCDDGHTPLYCLNCAREGFVQREAGQAVELREALVTIQDLCSQSYKHPVTEAGFYERSERLGKIYNIASAALQSTPAMSVTAPSGEASSIKIENRSTLNGKSVREFFVERQEAWSKSWHDPKRDTFGMTPEQAWGYHLGHLREVEAIMDWGIIGLVERLQFTAPHLAEPWAAPSGAQSRGEALKWESWKERLMEVAASAYGTALGAFVMGDAKPGTPMDREDVEDVARGIFCAIKELLAPVSLPSATATEEPSDKEMLDWLERDPYKRHEQVRYLLPISPYAPGPGQVRSAIASAMRSASPQNRAGHEEGA